MVRLYRSKANEPRTEAIAPWWKQIEGWRARDCLRYDRKSKIIKPQFVLEQLRAGRT